MPERIKVLVSIPEDFSERFANMIKNVNALNSDSGTMIIIEEVINNKPKIAAVPKNSGKENSNAG